MVALATAAAQKGCLSSADTSGAATATEAVSLAALPAATTDLFDQLTLSPVDGGQSPVAGADFGAATAVGDFNKDGYPDVAVGSPQGRTGAAADVASGTVTVFPGGANGLGAGKVLLQTVWGAADEAGDAFGSSLATGDFNKDGYADLAVGTPGESIGTVKAGAAAVFYGSSTGLSTAIGGCLFVLPGGNTALGKGYGLQESYVTGGSNQAGDLFGNSLAVGDFNGDGYADLLAGAAGRASGAGMAYTWLGGAVTTARPNSLAPGVMIRQADIYDTDEAGDRFGAALASGDLNKDGKADAVVGRPGENAPGEPAAGAVTTLSKLGGAS